METTTNKQPFQDALRRAKKLTEAEREGQEILFVIVVCLREGPITARLVCYAV